MRVADRCSATAGRSLIGTGVVVGLCLLAVTLAAFAVWFQWRQTRRCLMFYGARSARLIQTAGRVELWRLGGGESRTRPIRMERLDVSRAGGLVHLRRGLVEDANFVWDFAGETPAGKDPEPRGTWDEALAFFEPAADTPTTVLAFDLDVPTAMTVVGKPGRVRLGRIAEGVKSWIDSTRATVRH